MQAVLSQLLVLKCCSVLMSLFMRIDTSWPDNWCSFIWISKGRFSHIIQGLGYMTVCMQWVPQRQLNTKLTEKPFLPSWWHVLTLREGPYARLLQQLKLHFGPLTTRQSIEWHHHPSPWNNKFKMSPSVSNVIITVLWHCEGVILVDAVERGEAVSSDTYIGMLTKLRKCFR